MKSLAQLTVIQREILYIQILLLHEHESVLVSGFRTYSLVCFGSCLFGLASIYGFQSGGANEDPDRVAAQVVTGMCFLGAGAIMKFNGRVEGVTTATGMWVASAIGYYLTQGCMLQLSVLLFLPILL